MKVQPNALGHQLGGGAEPPTNTSTASGLAGVPTAGAEQAGLPIDSAIGILLVSVAALAVFAAAVMRRRPRPSAQV
jgi:hypothetical protein